MTKSKRSTKWGTVRCVVEYRTPSDITESDLARRVQETLDVCRSSDLMDSRTKAKGLGRVLLTMRAGRPRRLVLIAKALEGLAARLRKM